MQTAGGVQKRNLGRGHGRAWGAQGVPMKSQMASSAPGWTGLESYSHHLERTWDKVPPMASTAPFWGIPQVQGLPLASEMLTEPQP